MAKFNRKRKLFFGSTFGTIGVIASLGIASCGYGDKNIFFVTDGGAINDGASNQGIYDTVKEYSEVSQGLSSVSVRPKSSSVADVLTAFYAAKSGNAELSIANGFQNAAAVQQFLGDTENQATDYPVSDQNSKMEMFLVNAELEQPNLTALKNFQSLTFDTAKSGFEAGFMVATYLYSNSEFSSYWDNTNPATYGNDLKVAVMGGEETPANFNYMNGFHWGLETANAAFFGGNPDSKIEEIAYQDNYENNFTGSSEQGNQLASTMTVDFLNQGAQVIFAVNGGQIIDVLAQINTYDSSSLGYQPYVFGSDVDLLESTYAKYSQFILGSAVNDYRGAIYLALDTFYNYYNTDTRDQEAIDKWTYNQFGPATGPAPSFADDSERGVFVQCAANDDNDGCADYNDPNSQVRTWVGGVGGYKDDQFNPNTLGEGTWVDLSFNDFEIYGKIPGSSDYEQFFLSANDGGQWNQSDGVSPVEDGLHDWLVNKFFKYDSRFSDPDSRNSNLDAFGDSGPYFNSSVAPIAVDELVDDAGNPDFQIN